ncbi:hypothetical protein BG454_06200 [Roseinatronobacter bogoriensis subsp. barguzinensis]|uniref:Uncharacterized protein n=1 Tax=Roseinatronobacter bogoriensis subsp. barguzinensis TaxID=441209 RepID=A0A2K8KH21_9RHOB|nr:hypothetical protein BG454_06200 [Rhodobaca barguzinensis]
MQRRAAVRRCFIQSVALYAGQIRERSNQCAWGSQIAVPWGRPGDARRPSALIPRFAKPAQRVNPVTGYLFATAKI